MADIRLVRSRAGVRIWLQAFEVAAVALDPNMMAAFTIEELNQMADAIAKERERRMEEAP